MKRSLKVIIRPLNYVLLNMSHKLFPNSDYEWLDSRDRKTERNKTKNEQHLQTLILSSATHKRTVVQKRTKIENTIQVKADYEATYFRHKK